jgi:hypothetical protein
MLALIPSSDKSMEATLSGDRCLTKNEMMENVQQFINTSSLQTFRLIFSKDIWSEKWSK